MAKNNLFDTDLQQISAFCKALGHPARLAILRFLGEQKSCITDDISNELPLSRTTVSQHLTELKKMKLIQGEIDGVKVNYCLNMNELANMNKLINEFLKKTNCCEESCC
ncbi:MAG: winged helix-turn-helix transcriptional regulator [Bacteroidetes bacterium]|nr:winged helix-turn-helix transcriptional regulator [Bacteroidota bacterium]